MSTKIINTFSILGIPFFKLTIETREVLSPTRRKAVIKPIEIPKPQLRCSCDPNTSAWSPEAESHYLER
jgi:hypothetical protein